MKVKVCGITQNENMLEVAALLPQYLGFIFYGKSPRDVTAAIDTMKLNLLPESVQKVAVLVNEGLDKAKQIIGTYGFDAVQLHGEESPDYCDKLRRDCLVIKTFSVGNSLPAKLEAYENCCDLFLFDTAGEQRGGSGKKFDHSLLLDYRGMPSFLLGGGLSPGDATALRLLAARQKRFIGVDLNSRFEDRPGIKNSALLSEFMNELYR